MRNIWKRLSIILILSLIAPIAVFAAGRGEPAGGGGTDAQYDLTWYYLCNGPDDRIGVVEDSVNDLLLDKINATIDIQMIGWGDHAQKVETAIASGESVDLTFTAMWWNYTDWVSRGYFLPLNDLLYEYAPKTVEILGEDVFIKGSQINGVNYAVPTMKETCVPGGLVFNKAFLDKYGWDENDITAEEDLEPWLQVIKENEDVIPYLTDGAWYAVPWVEIQSPGFVVYLDGRDRKVHNQWELPEMKTHLELMHRWYQAGYIHPDAELEDFEPTDQRNLGNFFVEPQPLKGKNIKADELEVSNPDPNADYIDQELPNQRWVVSNHMSGSMQAIPVTSKNPERAMMFLELLHTDVDLINTLTWGVEGTHWTHTDRPNIVKTVEGNAFYGQLFTWMNGNVFLQYIGDFEDPNKNIMLKEVVDTADVNFANGFYFDPTPVAVQLAAVENAQAELDGALRTGTVDPAVYLPQMIAALKAAGSDEVIAEAQRQLDAFLGK